MKRDWETFKLDWKKSTVLQRVLYLIITLTMLIVGGVGIWKAILFAYYFNLDKGNEAINPLLISLLSMVILLVLNKLTKIILAKKEKKNG
jgi:hypothetical protein